METGEAEYMVLTLINLSEAEQNVQVNVADIVANLEKQPWEFINSIDFSYEENLAIPGRSIMRVPIDFSIPQKLTDYTFNGGITLQHTNTDGEALDLTLLQPFKIKVTTPTAEVPLEVYENLLSRYVLALLLLLGVPLIFIFYEKTPHKRNFVIFLAILSIYSVYFIGANKDNSLTHMIRHIQTDILEEFEEGATEDVDAENQEDESESIVETMLEDYEYKEEENETSYIEANSTVVEGDEDLAFPYEEELILPEPDLETISDGSEDIDTEISETDNADTDDEETTATEDTDSTIQASTETNDTETIHTNTIEETIEEYLETTTDELGELGARENPEFGIELKIERSNAYYKGTEMSVLALLTPEKLNREMVQYYVAQTFSMSDGGNARIQVRRMCTIVNQETISSQDIVAFQNAALKLLSDEGVSFERIQKYTDDFFENEILQKSAQNICKNLENAHEEARETLRRQGYLPKENTEEETGATEDIDEINERNVTSDADLSPITTRIPTTQEESVSAASGDTNSEEDAVTEIASTTDKPIAAETESKGTPFVLFDLPDQVEEIEEDVEEDEENTTNESEEENEEEATRLIELDLTQSQIVEMDIPDLIQLPPLTRQEKSYTARYNMGEFQMTKFNEASNWDGFFTFDVIQLNDGKKLDKMWIDINGRTLHPEENMQERNQFLHYQLSDDIFNQQGTGTYTFSPNIKIWVPSKAYPGQYNSDISFTIIQ